MKKTAVIFWISTTIIFLLEGVMPALTGDSELAKEGIRHLGFPDYFRIELTILKVLGAITLMYPLANARLKEWAYAGFTFNFLSAAIAHWAVDGMGGQVIFPIVMLGVLAASYFSWHKREAQETQTSSQPMLMNALP